MADELQSLAEEQEEKLYNMPDSLREAPTGQLLQDRADYCNEMADELEEVDFDLNIDEGDYEEKKEYKEEVEERKQEIISSVKGIYYSEE